MKIAISSTGQGLNDAVAEVFGRCPYFIIAEISAKSGSASGGEEKKIIKTETIKNEGVNQAGGAGIAAAQLIADNGVEAVIAKNVGPKAMDALKQFNIKVYNGDGTVREAVDNFIIKG